MNPDKINEKEAAVVLIADLPQYRNANQGKKPNKAKELSMQEYEYALMQLVSDHREQQYDFYVAYAPADQFIEMERIVGRINGFPQKGDSEGEKILNAFKQVVEKYGKVIVINKINKGAGSQNIIEALKSLEQNKIVLKRIDKEGEYCFIGMEVKGINRPFNLFDNISWDTDAVLNETLKILEMKMLSYSTM